MTAKAEQIRSAIAEQAGEWFVANRAGSLDAAERAAFVAWLKASPLHVREYLGITQVAHDLPMAVDEPTVSIDTLIREAQADNDENVIEWDPPRRWREDRSVTPLHSRRGAL